MKGKIKRIMDKGYGFIALEEEGKKDLFFHMNNLAGVNFNDLKEGDEVTFDIGTSPKGEHAENIQLA